MISPVRSLTVRWCEFINSSSRFSRFMTNRIFLFCSHRHFFVLETQAWLYSAVYTRVDERNIVNTEVYEFVDYRGFLLLLAFRLSRLCNVTTCFILSRRRLRTRSIFVIVNLFFVFRFHFNIVITIRCIVAQTREYYSDSIIRAV